MNTDTSEKGLETLIVRHMTGVDGRPCRRPTAWPRLRPNFGARPPQRRNGWLIGWGTDYDRTHALDLWHLIAFLRASQADTLAKDARLMPRTRSSDP